MTPSQTHAHVAGLGANLDVAVLSHVPCLMIHIRRALSLLAMLLIAACGQREATWTSVAMAPEDVLPLAWTDTNTLVVGHRGSIYRYDLPSRQLEQRLVEKH